MANDMVERIAQAIKDARALPGSKPKPQPSDVDRRAAIAALKALRDPTPEMVEAGRPYFDGDFSSMHAENCWSAMLSAAIGEG